MNTSTHATLDAITGITFLSAEDQLQLKELRRRLDQAGITELLAIYGGDIERINALYFDTQFLPAPMQLFFTCFALGVPVVAEDITRELSSTIIETLVRLGIATLHHNRFALNNLRLVYHFGILVFCEPPQVAPRFYYGDDPLALGRIIRGARGQVLDVCAGVGTQGLLCSLSADHVIAIEREQAVAPLFAINAILNHQETKIELRTGSLLEPVADETFDLVCSNPPLLPIPEGFAFPVVGDGGPDGLAITKHLLSALPRLLRPGGRCMIIGTILGNENGPNLQPFELAAHQSHLNIRLMLPSREPLKLHSPILRGIAETICACGKEDSFTVQEKLLSLYEKEGADYLYSFYLITSIADTPDGGITWTTHYLRNVSFWTL